MERQVKMEGTMERQVNGGHYGETSEWRTIWRGK